MFNPRWGWPSQRAPNEFRITMMREEHGGLRNQPQLITYVDRLAGDLAGLDDILRKELDFDGRTATSVAELDMPEVTSLDGAG